MKSEQEVREMSDRELMEELVLSQHKEAKMARITTIANVVLVIILAVVVGIGVPRFFRTLDEIDTVMQDANELVKDADATMKDIDTLKDQAETTLANVDELAKNANQMVEDNLEAVSQAMENFNTVDFEKLNNSIDNLSTVSERLNKMTSIFGG